MKRIFIIILCVVLSIALSSGALAEEIPDSVEDSPSVLEDSSSSDVDYSDVSSSAITDTPDGGISDDSDITEDSVIVVPDTSDSDSTDDSGIVDDSGSVEDGQSSSDVSLDSSALTINADTVYLTSAEDAVIYSVGDALSGCTYFKVDTAELGVVKIYIPTDYQRGSFTYDSYSNLVNIRSSTITGYILDGSAYTVRWSSFNSPQYRLVDYSSSSWHDLTVTDVIETNVQIAEDDSDFPLYPDSSLISLIIISVLGVIMLCQFMKS